MAIETYRQTRLWAAVLDGDLDGADIRSTRAKARADAAWLRNHPATRDRQLFGHGGVVEVIEVVRNSRGHANMVKRCNFPNDI